MVWKFWELKLWRGCKKMTEKISPQQTLSIKEIADQKIIDQILRSENFSRQFRIDKIVAETKEEMGK